MKGQALRNSIAIGQDNGSLGGAEVSKAIKWAVDTEGGVCNDFILENILRNLKYLQDQANAAHRGVRCLGRTKNPHSARNPLNRGR